MNAIRKNISLLPLSLAGFLAVFAMSYWGMHAAIYGLNATTNVEEPMSTHSPDPENPHVSP